MANANKKNQQTDEEERKKNGKKETINDTQCSAP